MLCDKNFTNMMLVPLFIPSLSLSPPKKKKKLVERIEKVTMIYKSEKMEKISGFSSVEGMKNLDDGN